MASHNLVSSLASPALLPDPSCPDHISQASAVYMLPLCQVQETFTQHWPISEQWTLSKQTRVSTVHQYNQVPLHMPTFTPECNVSKKVTKAGFFTIAQAHPSSYYISFHFINFTQPTTTWKRTASHKDKITLIYDHYTTLLLHDTAAT